MEKIPMDDTFERENLRIRKRLRTELLSLKKFIGHLLKSIRLPIIGLLQ